MEQGDFPLYGMSVYYPMKFSNFSKDLGQLYVLLNQQHYSDIRGYVRSFLNLADDLWVDEFIAPLGDLRSHKEYDAIQEWLNEEDNGRNSPGDIFSEVQRINNNELKCNLTEIYNIIKNKITSYDYQRQTAFDAFKNPQPLLNDFPSKEREVIPLGVREDWDEAGRSLEFSQFRAGSMMAFRAAEGMLRYYYWNLTNELPQDLKENNKVRKWGWKEIIDNLRQKGVDLANNHNIEDAQTTRNALAHGDITQISLKPEDALFNLEISKSMIHFLVTNLMSRRKALRVCVDINATFDTVLAVWLIDKYLGGIVDCHYLPKNTKITSWYSYTIGLGGKYDRTSNGSISQTVLTDLKNWINRIPDIRRLEDYVKYTIDQPEQPYPDDDNIHSLIRYLKRRNSNAKIYYSDAKNLLDIIFRNSIRLDNENDLRQLRQNITTPSILINSPIFSQQSIAS